MYCQSRPNMSASLEWLLLEALLPLFGATIFYALLGAARWLVTPKARRMGWAWTGAVDPTGWLYGGTILAVRAGLQGKNLAIYDESPYVVITAFTAAFIAGIILTAAMVARGEDPEWKPPPLLLVHICGLMAVIVISAFEIQSAAFTIGVSNA